jgi:hypothetical protein
MKPYAVAAALLAAFVPVHAHAQKGPPPPPPSDTIQFPLTVSSGAASCLPGASGTVTVQKAGPVEIMNVSVLGLPANTDFDFFVIQVPKAPFGLAWYQGDIETTKDGTGTGVFEGRFNIETFIISLGALPSPNIFPKPPAFVAQSTTGAKVDPVQIYHLGLWFNSAADARRAGCPATATPFNGVHNAGIQVLNTATFPDQAGPLSGLR